MTYGFVCKNCGEKVQKTMKISEYTANGHFCPKCGTEMVRDPKTFGTNFQVNCTGFFGKSGS